MVVLSPELIFGYVHILYPQLRTVKLAMRIGKRSFRLPDTLYLCTKQLNACRVAVQYLIVEPCPLVLYVYV